MSSPAQLAADRANAELSSGPKSPEGKAKSSHNAVKTALTGQTILLPTDDVELYQLHVQAFIDDFQPATPRECDLVQSIANTFWRLKRIPSLEAAILARGEIECAHLFEAQPADIRSTLVAGEAYLRYEKQIRNLHIQEARLFRRFQQERAELTQLQEERREKQAEALHQAALQYEAAQRDSKPFTPEANGFVFSIPEIEAHLELIEAHRKALLPRAA